MKHFISVLAVLSLCCTAFSAVDTAEIAAVRTRATGGSAISAADEAIIAKFWRTSLDRMFLAPEPQEVVEVRRQLNEQKGEGGFYTAYMAEGIKDIQIAFETVEKVENADRRLLVDRNLMILLAELQDVQLVPLALARIADADEVVRYWAVKTLTQSAMVTELAKPAAAETRDSILKAFSDRISAEPLPQINKMIIVFAGSLDQPTARQLLTSLADARIEAYKNWTIKNEELDMTLLSSLGGCAMLQQGEARSTLGRKFAELYAVVLQRYMKGQSQLTGQNVERLIAVIAEVDDACLAKTMEIRTGIRKAIQLKTGLEREYESLLGNRMMAGELATKLRFDYGKDASGKAITAPPELGPAPAVPAETVASK